MHKIILKIPIPSSHNYLWVSNNFNKRIDKLLGITDGTS
jgi:hypothetical protein